MQQPAALAADFYYGTEDDEDELDDTSSHRPVRPKSRTSKTPAKAATTTTATATAAATASITKDQVMQDKANLVYNFLDYTTCTKQRKFVSWAILNAPLK